MADQHSFDIVSQVDFQEVNNAINQTLKEISQRFDLKDANCQIEFIEKDKKINLSAQDEYKLKFVFEILITKLIKRNISAKAIKPGKIEKALGGTAKQECILQNGISKEEAKDVTKDIKNSNTKVQAQIQDDQIRVIAKKIDDLQTIQTILKEKNYDFPIQFVNYK